MLLNYKKLPKYSIGLLLFLLPILSILVKDWVSLTFLILTLGGMTYGLKAWKILTPEEKRIFIGFAVFCGLVSLTFFNSEDTREWFRRFEKYISFLLIIFPYLFLRQLNYNFTNYFIKGAVVAPFVWLTYYYITNDGGRPAWAYYAIFIGDFAVLIASLSIVYLVTLAESNNKKVISIMVFLLATLVAVLSQTRGAWLYYPVLFFMLTLIYRKSITPKQWMIGGILVVTTLSFLMIDPPTIIKNRIGSAVTEFNHFQAGKAVVTDNSIGLRLHMWQDSIKLFAKSPVLGVSIDNFEYKSKELISQGKSKSRERTFGHAHNIFFNALATTGLVGFLGLIILVFLLPFMFFIKIWCSTNSAELKCYSLSGIVLVTSFIVFGLTEAWLSRNPLVRTYLLIMVFLISNIMILNKEVDKNEALTAE